MPRLWAALLALLAIAIALPAAAQQTCTWNQNGPGQWDNPSNWNDCSLGNGTPSGTPGPADHAVIGNIAPLADIDLGASPRTVDRMTLSAGRIFGNTDLSIGARLIWTGGTIDGGGSPTQLTLGASSLNDISGGLHVLAKRDLVNLGGITWVAGDIELAEDAEIDNQGVLTIDVSGGAIRGIPSAPVVLTTDGSPLARLHNSSAPGARIEKLGTGLAAFAPILRFDNGNDVLVSGGILQVMGPGTDFGSYQVNPGSSLEFGPTSGVTRVLTGLPAVAGGGRLHKFGDGGLDITGNYLLTGLTEVVNGTLFLDTPANPLVLPSVRVQSPGILSSPGHLEITGTLFWDGGEIIGTSAGLNLTLQATATATITLDNTHPNAWLRSRDLVNLGSIALTGNASTLTHLWLDAASISNQGGFAIDNDSTDNLRIDCVTTDCGSMTNAAGATLTLNDLNGIIAIGSELAAFNNEGLVDLQQGCGAIGAPGVDTGTWRYAGSCTLWFNPRPDTERVLQASAILDPQGGTSLQLGGTVRANGASRAFASLIIDPTATLRGPAAITLAGPTHWRGLIEGLSLSESVTIASGAVVSIGPDAGDQPTLHTRTLFNDGGLAINAASLRLGGAAELRNNGSLNLAGTSTASGGIVCVGAGDCGSVINQASGALQAAPLASGPAALLDAGIGVQNQGALIAAAGVLQLEAALTTAPGSLVDIAPGAVLRRLGGNLTLTAGTLSGLGSIDADVVLDSVAVEPGGPTPGNLTVLGDYADSSNTSYQMAVAGALPPAIQPPGAPAAPGPRGIPSYDRLSVSGTATLAGTVNVIDLGYTPAGSDVFDLLVYASRSGAPVAGANPYSGLGFSLFTEATRVRLATAAAGGCEWNPAGGGPDNWDNPLKWNNCAGGVGPGPGPVGTPGASDIAIIGSGVVNLNVPVTVQELQLTGGNLQGPSNLTITTALVWTGGRIQGTGSELVTLDAGGVATLSGGQHTLDQRQFVLNGIGNWTTGLIELANGARFEIGPSGTLNSNPAGAFESFFGNGPGTAELRNFGAIVKLGSGSSGIGQSVQYSGPGSITVTGGELIVAATSVVPLVGSYTADAGAALQFVASNRSFGSLAALGGAGTLVFGDAGPAISDNTVDACISAGANLAIRHARLVLNCALATNLGSLLMIDDAAVLEGSSAISVTGTLTWGHGIIRGSTAQTFTLANGAVGTLPSPRGLGMPRVLDGRRFVNHGNLSWTGGNDTAINSGARFENESDGVFDLTGGGPRNVVTDFALAPRLVNRGTVSVTGGALGVFGVDFDNDGLVQLLNGQLQLRGNGSDSGNYVIDAGTSVTVSGGAVRQLVGTSSVSGAGIIGADSGAQWTVLGAFAPGGLEIGAGATVALDTPGVVNLPLLAIDQGTLTGNDEIHLTGTMTWDGGTVAGTGAPAGPLVIDAGATLQIVGQAHILDSREIVIAGNAFWLARGIRVPQNQTGRITVAASGSLLVNTTKSVAFLGCDLTPCTAELAIAGQFRNIGAADFQLSSPLQVNGGVLRVESGSFQASALELNAGVVEVLDPVSLQTSTLTINGGILRGTGVVAGDVSNVGGLVRPGTSPGQLDIFGAYTQGPGGTLEIEVAGLVPGVSSDFLFASGAMNLDGTLTVVDAGHALTAPQTLDFLLSDIGRAGSFATTNIPYAGYTVSYSAFAATLVPGGPVALVVNSNVDPGDGTCDSGECTLREAIAAANLAPDPDVIEFAIPSPQCTGPGGSCVIVPATPLPAISGPLLIDGYSQPGAVPNSHPMSLGLGNNATVLIELDGAAAGGDGLVINAPSLSLVGIHGLSLYRWNNAIHVQGPLDSNQLIGGNLIGLRSDGSAPVPAQGVGVAVFGGHAQIGSGLPADMNVIGGNATGVQLGSISAGSGVLVTGNLIGAAPNGVGARPNQVGILAQTASALPGIVIGSVQPDERNLISGNADDGIRFQCTAVSGACFDGAQVLGNFIGVAIDGSALGNGGDGIDIAQMSDGRLYIGGVSMGQGNRIAFNAGDGIRATAFSGVARASFLRNDIYQNGGLGIDLGGDGRTANDAGDPDTGPNGLLNFPSFTSYTAPGGNSAVIEVQLDTPDIGGNYPARVDFYKAIEDEPGVWLGTTTCAQPNVTCPASFAFPGGVTVTPDDVVVGVVTDGFGKSSEASFYATTTSVVAPDAVLGSSYLATVTVSSAAPFSILGDVNV
ncbi:MAG: CSLREA domain-containing protein, partial [Rhodanobacteraceae bacterium]|nr:CSLREA domain-containing protein [Rhodanobacteraceae bacterium]